MKRIKSFKIFDNFDLGREEIIDFFEDFDLVEIKSVEIKSVNDFIKYFKKIPSISRFPRIDFCKNFFGTTSINDYLDSKTSTLKFIHEKMMVITLDYYHPKMIRSSSFQYDNYIRETLKNRLQRVDSGYDMDVFMYIEGGVNYMSDPIAKVQLFIFNRE
jgi:hypothetical protein